MIILCVYKCTYISVLEWDGYRDQIVTMLHGVMWVCLCIPGHIHCSCSTVMALLCIPLSELVSFAFSTIPICPFLIPRIFQILSDCVVRQYRACVVDLLGLGIHVWCVLLYYAYNPSQSCLPSFCAIPIFHFLI